MILNKLSAIQHELGIHNDTIHKITEYYNLLLEYNNKINLISRKSDKDGEIIHIIDCLYILKFISFKKGEFIADLGTGAGLPGILLAIALPELNFILMDSNGKKCSFVKEIKAKMKINNIEIICNRLENIGHLPEYREKFDITLSRALTGVPTILEYSAPLLKIGGKSIAYKGKSYKEEISAGKKAEEILYMPLKDIFSYTLPESYGDRYLAVYEKRGKTDNKYPRKTGIPSKKPIITNY